MRSHWVFGLLLSLNNRVTALFEGRLMTAYSELFDEQIKWPAMG